MARKRDGLVPIGEALADLDGPVKAIREARPGEGYRIALPRVRLSGLS